MKYYLVAGEASGDLHGANLIRALKQQDADAEFRFFGGDQMQAEGGTLVKHYADMAYMGIIEVIANLRTILKNMRQCKKDILAWQPDVLVLIDFPGFNLKIADFAKANGILVCYYISPKVWAWNQKRVLKIKKVVDHMFCILPFEVDFYKRWDMYVDYIGNPLFDAISAFTPDPDFLRNNRLEGKSIIALLPGSRKQELRYLLADMVAVQDKFPSHQLVIAGAPSFTAADYTFYLNGRNVPVVFNATYDLLTHAQAAVVTSGTATLETALFNVPEVVVYKANALMIAAGRLLVKLKYISLVNLIANKPIVTELIQEECTPANIAKELDLILNDDSYRRVMLDGYDDLDTKMGSPGASSRAASLIINYANKK
ncbi:lipid-A-disaccharide synthase [Mucilaginibacter hurinus]|uniref:Lipid-A-disaccharide synthase n=1 Tax=Mucilaginibacter hurinus TaxID=2201324 RepID=A0A367GNB7_9SPHI|nr:lipid-A-disaccharide synthase [Mucilaginibacter hurinus]RCH54967.1 lipid-A-disaccharide synthase [Mucilaginibacter hurinus]